PAAPLHMGPAWIDHADRPRPLAAPARDRGGATVAAAPAKGLLLPTALPAPARQVRGRPRPGRAATRASRPSRPLLDRARSQAVAARRRRWDRTGRAAARGLVSAGADNGKPLLTVTHLQVYFPIKAGLLVDRQIGHVHAVD